MIIFLYVIKEHSAKQLLQCRSNFFVHHSEHLKQQLLMKIQNKKLLQMMEFSNILIIDLSRTQKNYNRNLLYPEMSTRSGSSLVLRVPIIFIVTLVITYIS
jgi:hypothetical protein